ncbi:winged helix DNA-binding domain-containing protein [Intrasporangium sp.]|uniref:winged helix DNA-binding domain-containing protein n=1 Tax=Intrasporangium sp. TaxID=1925024 RepID=UPI0033654EB1
MPHEPHVVSAIVRRRLAVQRLTSAPLDSAADVVRLLLGVQSQERDHALWSLAMRTRGATFASVRDELDSGAFVRTHILRQTWHFVPAQDLRWLQRLTSPRVEPKELAYVRKYVPAERDLDRALHLLGEAVAGDNPLTRKEIGQVFGSGGLPGSGPAVGHLLLVAELRNLVCGGPIRGKEHTYGLVDELVPPAPERTRDEALAELATRFFTGHGPAALKDLTRWATLTVADAKRAVAAAGDALEQLDVDGTPHWFGPAAVAPEAATRREDALLFPVYDEAVLTYPTVGFTPVDRAPVLPGLEQWWGWLVVDAARVGLWKRTVHRDRVTVETRLAPRLGRGHLARIDAAVARLGAFHSLPAVHLTA